MSDKFIPTSKKLTWVITIFFLMAVVAVGAVNVIYAINLSYLLGYLLPLESIIIVAYFGKSGLEHYLEATNQISQIVPKTIETSDTSIATKEGVL